MLSLVASAAAVFMAAALFIAGNMLLGTNVALRLSHEAYGAATIGLILTQYSVGFVAGTWFGPRLIRRAGHIRAFAALAAITGCAGLAYAIGIDGVFWALLRALNGFCGAILMVVLESWVNAHAKPQTRGRFLAVYMVTYYLAGAGGQLLVAAGDPADFRPYSLAAALLVLASVPLCLTGLQAPPPAEIRRLPLSLLMRVAPLGVAGAFAGGFASSAFYSLAPVHLARTGGGTGQVAAYMACAVLASMLLQYPAGRLGDRLDRRRMILLIALVAAAASLGIAALGQASIAALFLSSMLFTGVLACLYPSVLALTHDQLPGRDLVGANAALLSFWGIGQCTGPVIVAGAMSLLGPGGLYYGMAAGLIVFAAFVGLRLRTTPALLPSLQAPFAPTQATTPQIAEMDPRAPVGDEADGGGGPARSLQ